MKREKITKQTKNEMKKKGTTKKHNNSNMKQEK